MPLRSARPTPILANVRLHSSWRAANLPMTGSVLEAVDAHCSMRLGCIKRPAEYRIVDALRRSATGKSLRRMLQFA